MTSALELQYYIYKLCVINNNNHLSGYTVS